MLAFGAVYRWAAPPLLALGTAAFVLARVRPRLSHPIDVSALAVIAIVAFQLIPLPPPIRDVLSPESAAFHSAMTLGFEPGSWVPLTLDPLRTRTMLMLTLAAFALHAAARETAPSEGRRIARVIGWLALLASILGMGGRTLFPDGRIYGFWAPIEPGAAPFGAIINRNHFAAWAIMASVTTIGALAAHAARTRERAGAGRALAAAVNDTRVWWLLLSAAVTVAAVIMTASRSGFAALVAAGVASIVLMRRRANALTMSAIGVTALLCLAAALLWARPDRLVTRFDTSESDLGLRRVIWQQSIDIATSYPIAGVGAGAFPYAMTYYQRGPRDVFFNHAHNQYFEILTEGGILVLIPLAALVAAVAVRTRRGLRADAGSYFWIRVGASAALAGLAVVCIWESPFRTPATLMLAAVASGLAASEERP